MIEPDLRLQPEINWGKHWVLEKPQLQKEGGKNPWEMHKGIVWFVLCHFAYSRHHLTHFKRWAPFLFYLKWWREKNNRYSKFAGQKFYVQETPLC